MPCLAQAGETHAVGDGGVDHGFLVGGEVEVHAQDEVAGLAGICCPLQVTVVGFAAIVVVGRLVCAECCGHDPTSFSPYVLLTSYPVCIIAWKKLQGAGLYKNRFIRRRAEARQICPNGPLIGKIARLWMDCQQIK